MPRTLRSFHDRFQLAEAEFLDFLSFRIHFIHFRVEHDVAALGFEQTAISLEITRIVGQIFRIVELDGVDENTGHQEVVFFAGPLQKGGMPLVKGAHGRDEAHAFPARSLRCKRLAEFFFCSTD